MLRLMVASEDSLHRLSSGDVTVTLGVLRGWMAMEKTPTLSFAAK